MRICLRILAKNRSGLFTSWIYDIKDKDILVKYTEEGKPIYAVYPATHGRIIQKDTNRADFYFNMRIAVDNGWLWDENNPWWIENGVVQELTRTYKSSGFPTPVEKKKLIQLPPECHMPKERKEGVDYMAAVRAMCGKGQ